MPERDADKKAEMPKHARKVGGGTVQSRGRVHMDLEKFFDRVNHDVLMSRLARRVEDKRVLRLIRRYLQAGMMEDGLVSQRTQGTPQGGPLSPLLSNVLLDELDKELERRGHCFVRYADDCAPRTCVRKRNVMKRHGWTSEAPANERAGKQIG